MDKNTPNRIGNKKPAMTDVPNFQAVSLSSLNLRPPTWPPSICSIASGIIKNTAVASNAPQANDGRTIFCNVFEKPELKPMPDTFFCESR